MILVTGATGELGRLTLEFLLERVPATQVAALARDPSALAELADRGVDVRQGDYGDPGSLVAALAGIDRLLLISTTAFSGGAQHHLNVIAAAREAGVSHVYYTGIQRRPGSDFEISQVTEWDEVTEQALRDSGLAFTMLRNSMYVDVLPLLLGDDLHTAGVRVPAGNAPAALATRRDLAEATANALTTLGHAGRTYVLSAGDALSMREVAAAISEATGQPVEYHDVSPQVFIDERIAAGAPPPVAAFLSAWFEAVAAGEFSAVTGDLQRLLGRAPTPPRTFLLRAYGPAAADSDR